MVPVYDTNDIYLDEGNYKQVDACEKNTHLQLAVLVCFNDLLGLNKSVGIIS